MKIQVTTENDPRESSNKSITSKYFGGFPTAPEHDGNYSFAQIPREEVTKNNHSLHKYPAKFIPQIPRWALDYGKKSQNEIVLDPFCGSGTTLVEAGLTGNTGLGIDISPLAVLISKAKTSIISLKKSEISGMMRNLLREAKYLEPSITEALVPDTESLGLHETWSFWFDLEKMARLLSIREAIIGQNYDNEMKNFLLACLSSVVKAASHLSEDQIKVRFDSGKQLIDPYTTFFSITSDALVRQIGMSDVYLRLGAEFSIEQGSASDMEIEDCYVDKIITSPPYINAIDYTMAHKYNMFVLGMINPSDFKEHCRKYIGVTERAVRSIDIKNIPIIGHYKADQAVEAVRSSDSNVALNRAYVVAQYFKGMFKTLNEMQRVLKRGGMAFIVIGETNRIAGIEIQTADIIKQLAEESGLSIERRFFHILANRSGMRLNRAVSGGKTSREAVYVFVK